MSAAAIKNSMNYPSVHSYRIPTIFSFILMRKTVKENYMYCFDKYKKSSIKYVPDLCGLGGGISVMYKPPSANRLAFLANGQEPSTTVCMLRTPSPFLSIILVRNHIHVTAAA